MYCVVILSVLYIDVILLRMYVLASSREQYKCYCSVHLNSPCIVIANIFQVYSCWVCSTHYGVCMGMVFGVSQSECAGWHGTNEMDTATTAVHNLYT